MGNREHWEGIYESRAPDSVSWYRRHLDRSLAFIEECELSSNAHIVDVGGGASTLVDDLLARGYKNISVADISEAALETSKRRLGENAVTVEWVVGDVTTHLFDAGSVDLWHDRAVFHFLIEQEPRDAYIEALRRAVAPGGFVMIATFGPNGPEKCSGLPVQRYSAEEIAGTLGTEFELIDSAAEKHTKPSGGVQEFAYALCKRTNG
jgi:SAM-dependent methyltransferase